MLGWGHGLPFGAVSIPAYAGPFLTVAAEFFTHLRGCTSGSHHSSSLLSMVTEQGSYFNSCWPLTLLLAKLSLALEQEAGKRNLWTIQLQKMPVVTISEPSTAGLSMLMSYKACSTPSDHTRVSSHEAVPAFSAEARSCLIVNTRCSISWYKLLLSSVKHVI